MSKVNVKKIKERSEGSARFRLMAEAKAAHKQAEQDKRQAQARLTSAKETIATIAASLKDPSLLMNAIETLLRHVEEVRGPYYEDISADDYISALREILQPTVTPEEAESVQKGTP